MNAFSKDYIPQISWHRHDIGVRYSPNGSRGAAVEASKIRLNGSLAGSVKMMDIPSRDSINTETIKQSDKTDKIRRGGR
jgi:hypothetical protein